MEKEKKPTIKKLLETLDTLYELLGTQITEHVNAIIRGAPTRDYKDSCDILNNAIQNINDTLAYLSALDRIGAIATLHNRNLHTSTNIVADMFGFTEDELKKRDEKLKKR
jgi:hypothetical protein